MDCAECREHLAAYVEGLLDAQCERELRVHLKSCPACRAEAAEHEQLQRRLSANGAALATRSVESAVMNRIARGQVKPKRRIVMRRTYGTIGVGLAAAAAILAALFVPLGGTLDGPTTAAAGVLAQAAEAAADLHSVYIRLNTRTIAHDNFSLIGLDYPFVTHHMWKRCGEPQQWRVQKAGRVVVMDGDQTTMMLQPLHVTSGPPSASRGDPHANYVGWLRTLLDVDRILDRERHMAEQNGWEMTVTKDESADGVPQLVVSIEALAQGDFANDWAKNKSISASDHRRVFRFDAQTKWLEDLEVWVHTADGDVLVLDTEEVVYNPDLDPELFALELPEDVVWFEEPDVLPDNDWYAALTPEQAAQAFFQACADEDWDEVLVFWPQSRLKESFKKRYGGLEIVDIGEPFQSGQYGGWYVPYEIKLRSVWFGGVKKHSLAVRKDNAAGRYVVDGGL
jgi:hypothetical protein